MKRIALFPQHWRRAFWRDSTVSAAVLAQREAEAEWFLIRMKWMIVGFIVGMVVGMASVLYWLSTMLVIEQVPVQPTTNQERKMT